jgi:hypothetical protein
VKIDSAAERLTLRIPPAKTTDCRNQSTKAATPLWLQSPSVTPKLRLTPFFSICNGSERLTAGRTRTDHEILARAMRMTT